VTPPAQVQRSAAATSRRAQVVAATVQVIARDGYAQVSFARIAEQAGLSSTRLISYHFRTKDQLIAAVVEDVVGALGRHVAERVRAQPDARGQLRAYVEAVVGWTDTHRPEMRTLLQVLFAGAWTLSTGRPPPTQALEELLERGVRAGEFRELDPVVVASTVQRAVEALPFLLETRPDLDCAAYARELVTLFDLGTRRT
jgi:AcrR family transcriptional regulator